MKTNGKFGALLLSVAIALTNLGGLAYAADGDSSTADGEYVINASGEVPGSCTADTTVTYEGAEQSAKWNKSSAVTFRNVPTGTEGLPSYKNLNFLMYNEGDTDKTIMVQFIEEQYTKPDGTTGTKYDSKSITVNWTGWKVVTIPLAGLTNIANFSGTIYIYGHGWSNTYTAGNTTAYFDKVWLDKTESNMLWEDERDLANNSPSFGTFSANSNSVLKFDIYSSQIDPERYATVVLRDTSNHAKGLVLDWSGWKSVSYNVSDFGLSNLSSITLYIGESWSNVIPDKKPAFVPGDDPGITVKVKNVRIETSAAPEPSPSIDPEPSPSGDPEPTPSGDPEPSPSINPEPSPSIDPEPTPSHTPQSGDVAYESATGTQLGAGAGTKIFPLLSNTNFEDYKYINFVISNDINNGANLQLVIRDTSSYLAQRTLKMDFEGTNTYTYTIEELKLAQASPANTFFHTGWGTVADSVQGKGNTVKLLKVYYTNDLTVTGGTIANGYDKCNAENFEETLIMSADVDSVKEAYLESTDGTKIDLNAETDGNVITLTPETALKNGTQYNVVLKKIKDVYGFETDFDTVIKTAKKPLRAETPVFTSNGTVLDEMPASGSVTVKSTVENIAENGEQVTIFVVGFDADGKVVYKNSNTQTVTETEPEISVDATVASGIESFKAFVADSDKTPIVPALGVLGTDASEVQKTTGSADYSFTTTRCELTSDSVIIDGAYNSLYTSVIAAYVYDGEGNLLYVKPFENFTDKTFSFTYEIGADIPTGAYKVVLAAQEATSPFTYEFYYVVPAEKTAFVNAVNAITSLDAMQAYVSENYEKLNLKEDAITKNDGAKLVAEVLMNNKPFADTQEKSAFESITELVNNAYSVRDGLNNSDWQTIHAFIVQNAAILLGDNANLTYFTNLTGNAKSIVSQSIKNKTPFNTFSDFAAAFNKAISDYKSSQTTTPAGGGSTPSRGGSGTSSLAVPSIGQVTNNNEDEDVIFDDIDGVDWAKEYILKLVDKGVISLSDDKKFRPNDSVTREEFVKILSTAFGIYDENAEYDFVDVDKSDWSYRYIASLANAGILEGSNGMFGKGANITRQDMTTMIYRVLQYLGRIKDVPESGVFNDDSTIAEYARTSVYYMKGIGIVDGTDNNNFAPNDSASRAQAAKIIGMLLEQ